MIFFISSTNLRTLSAWGPSVPFILSGNPTTIFETSFSSIIFLMSRQSTSVGPRRMVLIPWAIQPIGSLIATPIVFVPTSSPITRIAYF
jgi:hypothetical protein